MFVFLCILLYIYGAWLGCGDLYSIDETQIFTLKSLETKKLKITKSPNQTPPPPKKKPANIYVTSMKERVSLFIYLSFLNLC